MKHSKSSFARFRLSLLRNVNYSYLSAHASLHAKIKSGYFPQQANEWLKEILAKEEKQRTKKPASIPNPDMPHYNANRTPYQKKLAHQRALAKRRLSYHKKHPLD